jgi:hypothetical protein
MGTSSEAMERTCALLLQQGSQTEKAWSAFEVPISFAVMLTIALQGDI